MQVLSPEQCRQFVEDGFVVVREVFDRDLAAAASELVWDAIGRHAQGWSSLEHPAAWYDNFVHLQYAVEGEPFTQIAGPRLYGVLYDLLGSDRWTWNESFGWWPVLLPGFASKASVRELGWHVDRDDRYPVLRVPEKAVQAIFYFSDVPAGHGGTAVFAGSHAEVARLLAEVDPRALNDDGVRSRLPVPVSGSQVTEVTGSAGDVLFAQPFLVHASNRNLSSRVRFACNPHIDLLGPLQLEGPANGRSLVEEAVVRALARHDGV